MIKVGEVLYTMNNRDEFTSVETHHAMISITERDSETVINITSCTEKIIDLVWVIPDRIVTCKIRRE